MSGIRTWVSASRLRIGLATVVGLFVVIQLVPYGRDHANPPVTKALAFDSPRTEQLAMDACGDCHSNITSWPIESNVAPMSWLIQKDVDEGRRILNMSEWDQPQPDVGELTEKITGGEMPPLQYKLLHPKSRLSDAEKAQLAKGLTASYQADPPGQ